MKLMGVAAMITLAASSFDSTFDVLKCNKRACLPRAMKAVPLASKFTQLLSTHPYRGCMHTKQEDVCLRGKTIGGGFCCLVYSWVQDANNKDLLYYLGTRST